MAHVKKHSLGLGIHLLPGSQARSGIVKRQLRHRVLIQIIARDQHQFFVRIGEFGHIPDARKEKRVAYCHGERIYKKRKRIQLPYRRTRQLP